MTVDAHQILLKQKMMMSRALNQRIDKASIQTSAIILVNRDAGIRIREDEHERTKFLPKLQLIMMSG